MLNLSLEQIIESWRNDKQAEFTPEFVAVYQQILQSIASGHPLPINAILNTPPLSKDSISAVLETLKNNGAGINAKDEIDSYILSITPTPIQFNVNNNDLFAWCALDSLFLPGLLDAEAEIKAICPATQTPITIEISPTKILSSSSQGVHLSVMVPGYSTAFDDDQVCGFDGAVCGKIHFFVSQEAANAWIGNRNDVTSLSLEDAWTLGNQAWVKPFLSSLKKAKV